MRSWKWQGFLFHFLGKQVRVGFLDSSKKKRLKVGLLCLYNPVSSYCKSCLSAKARKKNTDAIKVWRTTRNTRILPSEAYKQTQIKSETRTPVNGLIYQSPKLPPLTHPSSSRYNNKYTRSNIWKISQH